MNSEIHGMRFVFGCLLLASLAGCSSAAQETHTPEHTVLPTQTLVPPTPSPQPVEALVEVTLDGNDCTFSGPSEVPIGKINVAFDIKGDLKFGPWVDRFVDGKTYQDFLDIYIGPEESHPEPSWVEHPPYFTKDHEVWTFTLDEVGEHAILVGSYEPWREYICGPFQVVEAPSD
jgi:hypothetical protein